jgi:hypothetical protein
VFERVFLVPAAGLLPKKKDLIFRVHFFYSFSNSNNPEKRCPPVPPPAMAI